jgi:pimeloyl-ACP methyl ester carboxylesterase
MTTRSGFAEVNGTRLYYELAGVGQPLVLVHSLLFDHRLWDAQFPVLAEHYQVLRYDLRGFGRSDRADLAASDVDDLYELLRFLGIDHAYVMGLSMGAELALAFTLAHPDRVDALIAVGSGALGWVADAAFDQRWGEFAAAASHGDHAQAIAIFSDLWVDGPIAPATPAVRERAREIMSDYSFVHFAPRPAAADIPTSDDTGSTEAAAEPSLEDQLANLHVPTLIVVGDRDQPAILACGDALQAAIPGAQQVVISNAAHIIPLEQPEALTTAVLAFLAARQVPGAVR